MSTLYRKYRPQTFADLIGQNHIKITLQNELELGQIGHAYLFCGPRGLGKTTTARLFAKAVNCQNRKDNQSEPCNSCQSCLAITANSAIDIMEIDAASHTGVDQVRENIIENVRFTPNSSKYKVFIIDEVHMLSISAFNALLKTLEEPPEHAIFILCTTEIHKVPQTIISRCQRFDFRKVRKDEMVKRLKQIVKEEKKKVAESVLENIVVASEGCVRDAESLLGKILTLGDEVDEAMAELVLPRSDFSQLGRFLQFILERNTTGAIELINKLVDDGVDLQIFTDNLIEFLRKILLIKVGGGAADWGRELDEQNLSVANQLAGKFDYARLLSMIDLFVEKRQELKTSFIAQLPLELAATQLCEEVVCRRDDDFGGSGGPGGGNCPEGYKKENQEVGEEKIKEKIKDRLARLSHLKGKDTKPETVETVSQPELSPKQSEAIVELEKIVDSWRLIIDKLLEKNYTLASLLKISRPAACQGNVLEIAVKSNFYKDRLSEIKNKKTVEEAIFEAIGEQVVVKGTVDEKVEPLIKEENSSVGVETGDRRAVANTQTVPVESIKIQKSGDVTQEVMAMF